MYLTYEEYKTYSGKVSESAFPKLETDAEDYLNYYTQNRIEEATPEIKKCIAQFIDNMESIEKRPISSFSNDGVSVTYAEPLGLSDTLYEIAERLLPMNLMHAGVNL